MVRNTVSTALTPDAGNVGNGVILASPYSNLGFPLEYMFNEAAIVRVTRDSQSGATPGQETLQFNGVYGVTNNLHWLWPQGSNASISLSAISPAVSNNVGGKNWLTNGMMEAFTSNTPTGWHVHVGTPGTSILQNTTTYYDGISCLRFVGNGTEKTALWSQFGVDFSGGAFPADQLVVNLWYKLGSVPAAGVLKISLVDDTGTVLIDGSGDPASVSVSLPSSTTAWKPLSGFLRTPLVLPISTYLMIHLDTALSSGVTLDIDRISMARPSVFYPGGPQIACFSGSSNWMLGDKYTLDINNLFNGLMQSGCNKLLDLSNYGLILPVPRDRQPSRILWFPDHPVKVTLL